jgi:FKBP-type peptidyl-prolyl cis-trans isomerase
VVVPPGLAYGAAGQGTAVPPNATLIFDLDLVQVR